MEDKPGFGQVEFLQYGKQAEGQGKQQTKKLIYDTSWVRTGECKPLQLFGT